MTEDLYFKIVLILKNVYALDIKELIFKYSTL